MNLSYINDDPAVIRITGELDYDNCHEIESLIKASLAQNESVTLMLDSLDFIDSSGLMSLVSTAMAARKNGSSVKIHSLNSHTAHILNVSGFWNLFEINKDVEIRQSIDLISCKTGVIKLEIHPTKDDCRSARMKIAEFAEKMGFASEDIDDIKLALGEALSNVVRHGAVESQCIKIQCMASEDKLQLSIRYQSEEFDPDSVPIPNVEAPCEGGMGIHFMRLVMDSIRYRFNAGYASVMMVKQRQCSEVAIH
ncbi:anti-sigma factor antagonist [uncultured Desulfobulbus sp.]|uniref:anti-sigma factor antagonist n=1 Tax=uncultured Desulfobulbus sp. TaxID=239745 RepID=UPI0029C8401F|nr:anti-sigma factor antagonist [uncultured Desulfobulbus sp.]